MRWATAWGDQRNFSSAAAAEHLASGFARGPGDFVDRWVVEQGRAVRGGESVGGGAEGRVSHDGDAVGGAVGDHLLLLEVGVELDLVDGWLDGGDAGQRAHRHLAAQRMAVLLT